MAFKLLGLGKPAKAATYAPTAEERARDAYQKGFERAKTVPYERLNDSVPAGPGLAGRAITADAPRENVDDFLRGLGDGFLSRAESDSRFIADAFDYSRDSFAAQNRIIHALGETASHEYASVALNLFATRPYPEGDGPLAHRYVLSPVRKAAEQAVCRTANAAAAVQYSQAFERAFQCGGFDVTEPAAAQQEWQESIINPLYKSKERWDSHHRDPTVRPAEKLGEALGEATRRLASDEPDAALSAVRAMMRLRTYPICFPERVRALPNRTLDELGRVNETDFPDDTKEINTLAKAAQGIKPNTTTDYLATGRAQMEATADRVVRTLSDNELARMLAEYKPF